MSFFIVDYMKLNTAVKDLYNNLEPMRRFAIGMFEDTIRKEGKFK
jgi:Ni,Fe-hydrogenase III component G